MKITIRVTIELSSQVRCKSGEIINYFLIDLITDTPTEGSQVLITGNGLQGFTPRS
jgi:hypothetical protein